MGDCLLTVGTEPSPGKMSPSVVVSAPFYNLQMPNNNIITRSCYKPWYRTWESSHLYTFVIFFASFSWILQV